MTHYNRFFLVLVALVIAGCAGIQGGSQSDIDELKAGQEAIRKELAEIRKFIEPKKKSGPVTDISHSVNVADDPYKGRKDAPLTIVEYTDYQCPYCARHASAVLPKIQAAYIDTGKVRYILRDYPLSFHKQAAKAGEAAHCAGDQGKYWEMHDKLFENQRALGESALSEYAEVVGLDLVSFNACLDSGKYANRVTTNTTDGTKAGVRGTPSFVVGPSDANTVKGEKLIRGAVPYGQFQAVFDALLSKQ